MDIYSNKLNAYFFKSESGSEPVKEWLKQLSKLDRKKIGEDIQTVQFGWPLGMPLVCNLGKGLWEIRTKLNNRIARIIFFMDNNSMILVNGFIKKTQKTPKDELDIAIKRKKQYEQVGS